MGCRCKNARITTQEERVRLLIWDKAPKIDILQPRKKVFGLLICDKAAKIHKLQPRKKEFDLFICPSRDGPYYLIGYGGRPHRFLHNKFSSVYRIFTKLGHMIHLWKGKNPIYFGVIRSKVNVTINIISDNMVVSTW